MISQARSMAHNSIFAKAWRSLIRLARLPPLPLFKTSPGRTIWTASRQGVSGGSANCSGVAERGKIGMSPLRNNPTACRVRLTFKSGFAVRRIRAPHSTNDSGRGRSSDWMELSSFSASRLGIANRWETGRTEMSVQSVAPVGCSI